MDSNVGDQIREMRHMKGMTQQQLADRAKISVNSLRRYEANTRQPNIDILNRIADALSVTPGELLWSDPDSQLPYVWVIEIEEKMKQAGFGLGFDEDNNMWINYPDGILEVTDKDLLDLNKNTNSFLQFKLEELKQQKIDQFRPNRHPRHKTPPEDK